jgi:hypothetical protein
MAILEFSHKTGKGNIRKRLFYNPTTSYGLKNPTAYGSTVAIRVHKYVYEHPYLSPTLFTNFKGEKFITPGWIPVLPETTYNDIEWIKPEIIKEKQEPQTWKFESSSDPGSFYIVRKAGETLKCNCSGFFRCRDKNIGCKHCQQVRKELSNDKK